MKTVWLVFWDSASHRVFLHKEDAEDFAEQIRKHGRGATVIQHKVYDSPVKY